MSSPPPPLSASSPEPDSSGRARFELESGAPARPSLPSRAYEAPAWDPGSYNDYRDAGYDPGYGDAPGYGDVPAGYGDADSAYGRARSYGEARPYGEARSYGEARPAHGEAQAAYSEVPDYEPPRPGAPERVKSTRRHVAFG